MTSKNLSNSNRDYQYFKNQDKFFKEEIKNEENIDFKIQIKKPTLEGIFFEEKILTYQKDFLCNYLLDYKPVILKPRGLNNNGNKCFVNVVSD